MRTQSITKSNWSVSYDDEEDVVKRKLDSMIYLKNRRDHINEQRRMIEKLKISQLTEVVKKKCENSYVVMATVSLEYCRRQRAVFDDSELPVVKIFRKISTATEFNLKFSTDY